MNKVTDFIKIRADGKQVDDSMSLDELLAKGWKPSPVIEIQWMYLGKRYNLKNTDGMSAVLLNDGATIAVLHWDYPYNTFDFLNPDGGQRFLISNEQSIDGELVIGGFSSPSCEDIDGYICCKVIFDSSRLRNLFEIYIDVVSGAVVREDERRY
ncbi:hypothetical protein [Vibrio genomosp. F10]|uniref:hypothetical protein n=1 Tax=Vibrio genomosp. F10 TaxID=723171 RepID=UPI000363AEFE|nr:hypothetical protein [Vibrio genomosp. F10]OEF06388.1 hypothetical protein A1QI_18655 [Vibrio genomosp. F10 str. 9ZB36]